MAQRGKRDGTGPSASSSRSCGSRGGSWGSGCRGAGGRGGGTGGGISSLNRRHRSEIDRNVQAGGGDGRGELLVEGGAGLKNQNIQQHFRARLIQIVDDLLSKRYLI